MDEIVDVNTLFGPLPAASVDLSVDALLEVMQSRNVGRACVMSTLGLLLDPWVGNAATRAASSDHPELVPVATLNPTMFFGDTSALSRLPADGFRMVRFCPPQQGWPVRFEPFRALLEALAPTGLPIMMNVGAHGDITSLLEIAGKYPAPIILAEVGFPFLAEAIAAIRRSPQFHIEISRLLAIGSLKLIHETVGADRLLFGSGAPARALSAALYALNFAGLPEDAQAQVLSGNARRLLKI